MTQTDVLKVVVGGLDGFRPSRVKTPDTLRIVNPGPVRSTIVVEEVGQEMRMEPVTPGETKPRVARAVVVSKPKE